MPRGFLHGRRDGCKHGRGPRGWMASSPPACDVSARCINRMRVLSDLGMDRSAMKRVLKLFTALVLVIVSRRPDGRHRRPPDRDA